jgi:hypothetical protein
MTDRAKKAIGQLMYVCRNTVYQGTLEVIEDELRRCQSKTLRETADHIETEYYLADDAARWMRRMAEEAESERYK